LAFGRYVTIPLLILRIWPWLGPLPGTTVTLAGTIAPSGSLSLAITLIATCWSSFVVAVSSRAIGSELTITAKVSVTVRPVESVARTVISDRPNCPAPSCNVRIDVAAFKVPLVTRFGLVLPVAWLYDSVNESWGRSGSSKTPVKLTVIVVVVPNCTT